MPGSRGYISHTKQGTWSSEDGWISTNYVIRKCSICKQEIHYNLLWVDEEDVPKKPTCKSCERKIWKQQMITYIKNIIKKWRK